MRESPIPTYGRTGSKMPIKNYEMIEKMKMKAIHRCAERIEKTMKEGTTNNSTNHSHLGISAHLKAYYGL
jgi:hypothetical protein